MIVEGIKEQTAKDTKVNRYPTKRIEWTPEREAKIIGKIRYYGEKYDNL